MVKVTYRLFRRYDRERTFDDMASARKFFYGYCVCCKDVSRAELKGI